MENFESLYNVNILPLYGNSRNYDYDKVITKKNNYPHQYSINPRLKFEHNSFSIDPPGCKDADDAFSVFKENDKLFLAIHIADPTEYIDLNSDLWSDIVDRVITHYPSNRDPIHLMPEHIINSASLSTNDDSFEYKNAISIITEIDQDTFLPINNVILDYTMIKLNKENNLSYDEASTKYNDINEIKLGLKISEALKNQRSKKTLGTKLSEINDLYPFFESSVINYKIDSNDVKNLKNMIGEFAIFANSFVGEYLKINLNGLGIFRTCDGNNINNNNEQTGQSLLDQIINKGITAEYLASISSHDLVGTPVYCHFTSPIRRLADCICHYLLKSIKLSLQPPWSIDELDQFSKKCCDFTKKERNIQYNDKKFRLLQLIHNLLEKGSNISIQFRISGYTGLFLNCIINKLFIDEIESSISVSYTLRLPNIKIQIDNEENFKIKLSNVNPYVKFDSGTIPELDEFVMNRID